MRNINTLGRYPPRRPNAQRLSTIWLTPVLCPIAVKAAKIAQPMRFPTTMTAMVSHRPSLRTMPSAPSAQLIGAIFAPAQIHICCGPVESRSQAGMGSTLWVSALRSEVVIGSFSAQTRGTWPSGNCFDSLVRAHREMQDGCVVPAYEAAAMRAALRLPPAVLSPRHCYVNSGFVHLT